MAKSFQYGRVSVKVTPDLDGFYEELKAKLKQIEKKAALEIKVGEDHTKATAEIAKWRKAEEADKIDLDVKVNKDKESWTFSGDLEKELAEERKVFEKATKEIEKAAATQAKEALRNHKEFIRQMAAAEKELQRRQEETRKAFFKGLTALGNFSQGLLKATFRTVLFSVAVAAASAAVANLSFVIGGAIVALGSMGAGFAGAGLGVAAGLVTAFLAVKLATSGMGEAMQAVASGDAAALKTAMGKLTPAAQGFVKQIASLKPALDELKKTLQESLFKALGDEVGKTGAAILKIAKQELPGVTKAIGEMGREMIKFTREGENLGVMKGIIRNIADGFGNMRNVGKNLVSVLLDLIKAGTDLLPGLGTSFENVTGRWAARLREMRQSGDLKDIFQAGLESIKSFGRSLRDLGKGIANIWRVGAEGSGGFLGILEKVTSGFRNWTESISGQLTIRRFFDGVTLIADAFGRLLKTLEPVMKPLGNFVTLLAEGIAAVLDGIGPQLKETLVKLFEQMSKTLPILVPLVIRLANAALKLIEDLAPLLPILAKILTGITDLIGPAGVAAIAIGLLGGKVGLLVGASIALGFALATAIQAIKNLNSDGRVSTKVIDFLLEDILNLGPGAADGVNGVIDVIIFAVTGRAPDVKRAGKDLMTALGEGINLSKTDFVSGVKNAINEALTLLSGGKSTFNQSGMSLMDAVNQGWRTQDWVLKQAVTSAIDGVLGILGIKTNDFATQGSNMGKAFTDSLTAEQRKAIEAVRATIQALLDAMSGKKSEFAEQGRDISRRLGGGIAADQSPQNAARAAVGQISGIFGGTSLFGAGSAIMASLKSGIVSGIQAVKNVLTSMTSLIPTWKGPMTLDRVLLTPAGEAIMQGLVRGIKSQAPLLQNTLGNLTKDIENALGQDPARTGALAATQLMQAWTSGVDDGTPGALKAVDNLVKGTSATIDSEWKSTVSSEGFGSLASEFAAAMDGMEIKADGKAIAKVVDSATTRKARR